MKVGFIGLGVMGTPMTLNLLRAGHEVAVFARRRVQADTVVDAGAAYCDSPAAVARRAGVVFSMVTAGADVREVALGEHGIVHGAAPGSVFVDMSTIAPGAARGIAAALRERGIEMLDAPVSGGEAGARDATLSIMVGGETAVLERVRPLFTCVGRTLVHIGGNGAGQVAKACNQMLLVNLIQASAEAYRLAQASGVDFARVRDAALGGSAASKALDIFGRRMAQRTFEAGVQARLHHKDYGILMNEAAGLGVPLPVAAIVWQQLNALMAQGWGGDDTASLLRVLELQEGY